MLTLENWAQLQILLVLESVNELARGRWDYDSLLGLVLYAYSTGNQYLISSTTTFIQYFVSTAVDGNRAGRAISSRLITCLRLYKCAKIRDEAPALFGCLFVFILSLGHTSPAWTSYLTREDRATLYAAQAHLTVICEKLENTRWLTTDQPEEYFKWICDRCKPHLLPVWKGTIGSLSGKLTSKLTLEDITLLARLPQYRQAFRTKLDQIKVPSASETCHYQHSHTVFRPTEADRGPLTRAEHTCLESPRKMTEVDRLIQNVFSNLAGKHDYFSL
ncbi:unnamed protein product [Rhizoctonia solani]|uniref:Uncharacterized protein n=1 Tax=Rhizoctonia solani TaxID=456999 RepID=A0A8H3HLF8_9AGAM|nr:unnamed protein product [Rhizoctonia solani]